ncbi:MAG: CoA transferase [Chloroflexi bacterium]|nr:CoA transferase [Chloroflexota bacterium]
MRSTLWAALSNPDEWWGFHLDSYLKPPDMGYHTQDGAVSFTLGRVTREQRDELYRDFQMEWVKDDPMFQLVDTDPAGSGSRYGWKVKPVWEKAFSKFTTAEVLEIGRRHGATTFEKNNYAQMVEHPQVQHVGMVTTVDHPGIGPVDQLVPPWDFSETPAEIRMPAPRLGEHNAEILGA